MQQGSKTISSLSHATRKKDKTISISSLSHLSPTSISSLSHLYLMQQGSKTISSLSLATRKKDETTNIVSFTAHPLYLISLPSLSHLCLISISSLSHARDTVSSVTHHTLFLSSITHYIDHVYATHPIRIALYMYHELYRSYVCDTLYLSQLLFFFILHPRGPKRTNAYANLHPAVMRDNHLFLLLFLFLLLHLALICSNSL